MNHMFCTVLGHKQSSLIGVCIAKKCELSLRLVCGHCSFNRLHEEHLNDIMSLEDFCNLSDQGLKIMEEREQFFKGLKDTIRIKYKEFYQKMQVQELMMMNVIDEYDLEIKRFHTLFENLQKQNQMNLDQEKLKEFLQQFGTHFHVDELRNSVQQFKLTLSDEAGNKCARLVNLYREVKNIITGLVEQSQKIDNIIDNFKSEPLKPKIHILKKTTNSQQVVISKQTTQFQDIQQQKKPIKIVAISAQNQQQNKP